MDLTGASLELMHRQADRECRKNYGFGLEEIPPMTQWEAKIRKAAVDAYFSASYRKGQQRRKIEDYNQVARRYRALADAEFLMRRSEIKAEIAEARLAGTYQEPGLAEGVRNGVIGVWILCFIALILAMWLGGTTFIVIGWGTFAIATALVPLLWNCPADDPRLIEARRKRRNMYVFWTIVR
jgi:hypothetical protein